MAKNSATTPTTPFICPIEPPAVENNSARKRFFGLAKPKWYGGLIGRYRTLPRKTVLTASAVVAALLALILAGITKKQSTPVPPLVTQLLTARFRITVSPPGSAIFLNGVEIDLATPELNSERKAGNYEIEARHAGYQTQHRRFEIGPGETIPIAFNLVPENPTLRVFGSGRISIDSDPAVEIADREFSRILLPGQHTVRIVMSRTGSTSVSIT